MEATAPLDRQSAGFLFILEGCHRRLEVAGVGEAVRTDGTAVGQRELGTVVLADVATCGPVDQLDLEFDAARDDANFAGSSLDPAELGEKARTSLLRHDEHLAVGVVEIVALHR